MGLFTLLGRNQGQFMDQAPGDLVNTNEQVQANATAGSTTLTVDQVLGGILNRTGPGGAYNDTTPTASAIINGLIGNIAIAAGATTPSGVNAGTTWRFRHINTVAFVGTIVAGAGVTLAGVTANAASSYREYLFTVLNGTPPQTFAGTTTNASAVITGLNASQTSLLSPGMAVAGAGIQAGSTVLSVQPGVGVTLSLNATATASLVSLAFTPRVEMRGIGSGLI